jgi:hypothetical protein
MVAAVLPSTETLTLFFLDEVLVQQSAQQASGNGSDEGSGNGSGGPEGSSSGDQAEGNSGNSADESSTSESERGKALVQDMRQVAGFVSDMAKAFSLNVPAPHEPSSSDEGGPTVPPKLMQPVSKGGAASSDEDMQVDAVQGPKQQQPQPPKPSVVSLAKRRKISKTTSVPTTARESEEGISQEYSDVPSAGSRKRGRMDSDQSAGPSNPPSGEFYGHHIFPLY